MRTPSRRMHQIPPEESELRSRLIAYGLMVLILAWVGGLFWIMPLVMTAVVSVLILMSSIAGILHRRREQRIALSRPDESICSFARSFDCRSIDTWIIRAVYENFQPYVGFPLRASDNLYDDLCIDPEDVDDFAEEIGRLTSRPLENSERNPLFGKVETLADLVCFFSHQERMA